MDKINYLIKINAKTICSDLLPGGGEVNKNSDGKYYCVRNNPYMSPRYKSCSPYNLLGDLWANNESGYAKCQPYAPAR